MSRTRSSRDRRILVYTDSRGQYKRSFQDQQIFTERLPDHLQLRGYAVDLILCPFKWTTTIDLIELLERGIIDADHYEKIVLYSGVVEWSPRNLSNFTECVAGDDEAIDVPVLFNPKRSKRIANNKLRFLRQFFGEAAYDAHAQTSFPVEYRGEPTRNLISMEMLEKRIVPYLKEKVGDDRLIVINANRLIPGWDGNYREVNPDGRPANIGIIEDYSAMLGANFSNVIDLLKWSDEEIRHFTVDNLHLTHAGSEWMFDRLTAMLE